MTQQSSLVSKTAMRSQLIRRPLTHEETEVKRGLRVKPVRVRKGGFVQRNQSGFEQRSGTTAYFL